MVYRNTPPLRPETALEDAGPRFGEYRVNLLTRRTWALYSQDVVNRRESAPNANWNDPRSFPDSLTCRDGSFRIE
ncbi:MAG: hypothetical protein HY290_09240 [Planctomycetia bacterium]|nr:hypothetical protein [Planctomycetia bacterium]